MGRGGGGGWKLKLTRVHATEYGIYGTKYLLVHPEQCFLRPNLKFFLEFQKKI